MLFVILTETITYAQHKRSLIYVSELLLNPRPSIDISERKFIVVFRHTYSGTHYATQKHKMFRFEFYYARFSSEIGPLGYPYHENLFKIEPTPCDQLKRVNLADINYSPEQLKDAQCFELSRNEKIGYFNEGENNVLAQLAGYIKPCQVTPDNDCLVTDPEGNVFDTRSSDGQLGPVSDFFRDFTLEMDFIQDTVDLNDFEKPIKNNLLQAS